MLYHPLLLPMKKGNWGIGGWEAPPRSTNSSSQYDALTRGAGESPPLAHRDRDRSSGGFHTGEQCPDFSVSEITSLTKLGPAEVEGTAFLSPGGAVASTWREATLALPPLRSVCHSRTGVAHATFWKTASPKAKYPLTIIPGVKKSPTAL